MSLELKAPSPPTPLPRGERGATIYAPWRLPCAAARCRCTAAGSLARRPGLRNLSALELYKDPVTDVGVTEFREFKNLTQLTLTTTRVTDAGLKEIGQLTSLKTLFLGGTQVTDIGLEQLKQLTNLTYLDLNGYAGHGSRRQRSQQTPAPSGNQKPLMPAHV
jgi:hypothetical protein